MSHSGCGAMEKSASVVGPFQAASTPLLVRPALQAGASLAAPLQNPICRSVHDSQFYSAIRAELKIKKKSKKKIENNVSQAPLC
jgi:hypothetical protein